MKPLLAGVLLSGTALLAPLAAQTPVLVYVLKLNAYNQVTATRQDPYEPGYAAIVSFRSAVPTTTQVELRTSLNSVAPLARLSPFDYYREDYFADMAALDRTLPDGPSSISVSGGGTASSTTFHLVSAANLRPVTITNFDELQDWAGPSLRIDWSAFDSGTADDFVTLDIRRADNTVIFRSASLYAPGALTGNSTTITIDRLDLAAGETVYGNLSFSRIDLLVGNGGNTVIGAGSGYYIRFPIKRGKPASPVITSPPESLTVALGGTVALHVGATGSDLIYRWKKNGLAIAGATEATYLLVNAQPTYAGTYSVDVSNAGGTTTSLPATLSVLATSGASGLRNLAIRSPAGTGSQTLIVGFVIGGAGTAGGKPILIRAAGPALGAFGLTEFLADPRLELYANATGTKLYENDNWAGDAQVVAASAEVGAFSLGASSSRDAALYVPAFAAGAYSAQISGANNATGVVLAEIYDATASERFSATTPRLTNLSARTQVGAGDDVLIAGFHLGGQTATTLLLRAIGPTLASFGVGGTLGTPKLELFRGTTKIAENSSWGGSATLAAVAASVGAFPLSPSSRDAVLLLTLPPGSYTAQVSGVDNTSGVALIEVYEVP